MPTAMVAKKNEAHTIQSACMTLQPFRAHFSAVPGVKMLHAVFHRALIGADFVVAARSSALRPASMRSPISSSSMQVSM